MLITSIVFIWRQAVFIWACWANKTAQLQGEKTRESRSPLYSNKIILYKSAYTLELEKIRNCYCVYKGLVQELAFAILLDRHWMFLCPNMTQCLIVMCSSVNLDAISRFWAKSSDLFLSKVPSHPLSSAPLYLAAALKLWGRTARQWSMASAHLRKSIKVSLILSDGFDFGLGEVIKMWERGKRQEAYFYKQPILFKTISQPWARINLLWLFRWFRAMERCQEEETQTWQET